MNCAGQMALQKKTSISSAGTTKWEWPRPFGILDRWHTVQNTHQGDLVGKGRFGRDVKENGFAFA